MQHIKLFIKRVLLMIPIAAIGGMSFMPLPTWGRQTLVLFALLWFGMIVLFEAIGK
jgi:hypothetical protein